MSPIQPSVTISVGIATRNRIDEVELGVRSTALLGDRLANVIVNDDSSDPPVEPALRERLGDEPHADLVYLRQPTSRGPAFGRNAIAKKATGELLLLLDDDAYILDAAGIFEAARVLERDPSVGAVALTQADAEGKPHPPHLQPAPVTYPCLVPTFIGYGVLVRTAEFLSIGGFRELFHIFNEEKEFCKRLLDRGLSVVYLPDSKVAHIQTPRARVQMRHVHLGARNAIYDALYNEPLPRALLSVPARMAVYARWLRGPRPVDDRPDEAGMRWLASELVKHAPEIARDRRALKWSTYRQWDRLRKEMPRYMPPTR